MIGAVVSSVPRDERCCPLCDQPIVEAHAAMAILATGELRWAHPTCAIHMNGGRSAMIPSARVAA